MSRAVMEQVLAVLERGDVMCEVIAAGMLRTALREPEQTVDARLGGVLRRAAFRASKIISPGAKAAKGERP
jgi:hypothetical protein